MIPRTQYLAGEIAEIAVSHRYRRTNEPALPSSVAVTLRDDSGTLVGETKTYPADADDFETDEELGEVSYILDTSTLTPGAYYRLEIIETGDIDTRAVHRIEILAE